MQTCAVHIYTAPKSFLVTESNPPQTPPGVSFQNDLHEKLDEQRKDWGGLTQEP